jgi:hypothetical protein
MTEPIVPPKPWDPPGPIQCAHEFDEKKKCKKCGFWHDLGQNLGEAIGEAFDNRGQS